jgi:hypothetical protein
MVPEVPVLGRDQGVQQHGRHVASRGTEPPNAARGREQRDRSALPVEDLGPRGRETIQVQRKQPVQDRGRSRHHQDSESKPPQRADHRCLTAQLATALVTRSPAP